MVSLGTYGSSPLLRDRGIEARLHGNFESFFVGRALYSRARPTELRELAMKALPNSVSRAFDTLQQAVERMEARNRVTRVAGVKPEMVRLLPGFDERHLGFKSFSAFVDAAVQHGLVRTTIDSEHWPRVESTNAAPRRQEEPRRLRPDIWRAFTQWGDGWIRVWDRGTARAVRLSEKPTSGESPEHAQLRAALDSGDRAVIRIEPIDQTLQRQWMDDFAAAQGDHPLASALAGALKDERPFRAFNAVLGADERLRREYDRERMANVLSAVRRWAAAHDVDIDSLDHTAAPLQSLRTEQPTPSAGKDEPTARLRAALHKAIDEMSIDELRRVWVPLGYISDAFR